MPELQYKTKDVPAFIKSFDEEQGILKGYAAIMGFPDSYKDIIEPGAFKSTLKENKGRIALCWQHNWHEPIGKPHIIKEHDHDHLPEELLAKFPKATGGLYFESKIVDTRQGKDAKELIRQDVLNEMSIGYDIYEGGEHMEDGFNHLTDIILYEISPVTMAAMPAAQITDYKGLKVEETEDYIRIPIPGVSCEITATIEINKDKGIKALYCGKEKKVRTLLFAKDKGWTIESAKKWYEEHKEDFKEMEIEILTKGDIINPIYEKAAKLAELCRNLQYDEANELIKELAEELGFLASRLSVSERDALALHIRVCEADLEAL